MIDTRHPVQRLSGRPSLVSSIGLAIAVGLAVGALTAYAQGWLSDEVSSLANSAGPWSLAAFLVARFARRPIVAVPAAVTVLLCCEIGYALATNVRGGSNATSTVVFWLLAGVLAGPALGVAGAWSTRRGIRRSAGWGVIAGVLIGEGAYGWTTIADTTDWRYWAVELAVGVAIVATVAARARRASVGLVAVGAAAATATVVYLVARLV